MARWEGPPNTLPGVDVDNASAARRSLERYIRASWLGGGSRAMEWLVLVLAVAAGLPAAAWLAQDRL
ncbi:MAG: hypothetical protein WCA12_11310, partial [Burkholderiales bacterium]